MRELERLQAEGRMPSLSKLLGAIAEVRAKRFCKLGRESAAARKTRKMER